MDVYTAGVVCNAFVRDEAQTISEKREGLITAYRLKCKHEDYGQTGLEIILVCNGAGKYEIGSSYWSVFLFMKMFMCVYEYGHLNDRYKVMLGRCKNALKKVHLKSCFNKKGFFLWVYIKCGNINKKLDYYL